MPDSEMPKRRPLFSLIHTLHSTCSSQLSTLAISHQALEFRLMALTRHCWKCGTEYKLSGTPGRSESCHQCGSDLKVCLNCVSYDARVAQQCRDRRADPVAEKHLANYCEYFEMIRREYRPPAEDNSREAEARDTLKKLLGD